MSLQPPLRGDDLLTSETQTAIVPWLWEGLLAAGNITLLTSVWKAGKSTLLALLLALVLASVCARAAGQTARRLIQPTIL